MADFIIIGSLFVPSIASIVWFVMSIVKYKKTAQDNPNKRVWRAMLIASSIVGVIVLASTTALATVFILAIAYM